MVMQWYKWEKIYRNLSTNIMSSQFEVVEKYCIEKDTTEPDYFQENVNLISQEKLGWTEYFQNKNVISY